MQSERLNTHVNVWKPHNYQLEGMKFLLGRAGRALFFEPGAGKTSTVLGALKTLISDKKVKRVLIIAPLRVCMDTWPNEIEKWSDFNGLTYTVLHGKDKDKNLKKDVDIYLINFEGLDWLLKPVQNGGKVEVNQRRWAAFGFDMVVIDELSKFKNIGTKRYKAFKQVATTFKRRWGLTGSPTSNGLMNLFGECYMLDHGETFGPYVTQYRNKYFIQGRTFWDWRVREGAKDEIFEKIKPLAMVIDAGAAVDLPDLVINDVLVKLPEAAQAIYTSLETDLFAVIGENTIEATIAIAAVNKCQQIANGNIYITPEVEALVKLPTGERTVAKVHTAKFEALSALIEELDGSPLLIGYTFQHDYDEFCAFHKEKLPRIGGGTSDKEAKRLITAWNAGELPVLFGHPASIGHGLNLQQAGNHVCWLSLTWDFELYDQFIRRVYRQGVNAKRVFVHRIIARDTIDETIKFALLAKDKGQKALFDALRNKI